MSSSILVDCPKCATRLQLVRPQQPSIVTCPSCGQQIRIAGVAPPTPPADPFASLPAPIASAAPAPIPRRPIAKRTSPKTPTPKPAASPAPATAYQRIQRKRKTGPSFAKTALVAAACLGGAAVVGVGGYLAWDYLPTESLRAMIPIMDSPEKVLKEYVSVASELRTTIDSIEDDASRDAAIPKIQALANQCRGLTRRVFEVALNRTETQVVGRVV